MQPPPPPSVMGQFPFTSVFFIFHVFVSESTEDYQNNIFKLFFQCV